MLEGRERGKNRSKGRRRERGRSETRFEFHGVRCEVIDIRTGVSGISITPQMVCPQRIHGDDDDILRMEKHRKK
jgi:hypothetical protein